MGGKRCQQEETFRGVVGHSKGDAFKEVVDTEGEHNEESSCSGLDALLYWNFNLVMTVSMARLDDTK